MSDAPLSSMVQNAQEQWLSSDANRAQALSSRELQNILRSCAKDAFGGVKDGLIDPTDLVAIAASFTMTLQGAGAFMEASVAVGADSSKYLALRWADQVVTFAAPDPALDRIDVVAITAAVETIDPQSRNILVDPATHVFAPATVNKSQNPKSTISVVTGVPAVTPVPLGIVGANTIALFEVRVPAAAPDSTTFEVTQRIFRQAPWPWAATNGILAGTRLQWLVPTVVPTLVTTPGSAFNYVVIDGEVIPFTSDTTALVPTPLYHPDAKTPGAGGTNPFDAANPAPAGSDKPFYIYVVGGRHSPQASGHHCPVGLVFSTTPPDRSTWNPTATIQTARGDTTRLGALYVGMGFTAAGTATSKCCFMDGDWVYPLQPSPSGNGFEAQAVALAGATTNVTLGSCPPFARRVKLALFVNPNVLTVSQSYMSVEPKLGLTGAIFVSLPMTVLAGPVALTTGCQADVAISPSAPQLLIRNTARAAANDTLDLEVIGYPHHAPRMDGGAGTAA